MLENRRENENEKEMERMELVNKTYPTDIKTNVNLKNVQNLT